jgi:hypothetical protein
MVPSEDLSTHRGGRNCHCQSVQPRRRRGRCTDRRNGMCPGCPRDRDRRQRCSASGVRCFGRDGSRPGGTGNSCGAGTGHLSTGFRGHVFAVAACPDYRSGAIASNRRRHWRPGDRRNTGRYRIGRLAVEPPQARATVSPRSERRRPQRVSTAIRQPVAFRP